MSSPARKRATLVLLTLVVLAPAVCAYVNGGVRVDTLGDLKKQLRSRGWGVHHATPIHDDCFARGEIIAGVRVNPPINADYRDHVNELIGKALQGVPAKELEKVTPESKREVARLARLAIRDAVLEKKEVLTTGQTGPLRYHVGVFRFDAYWETNYDRKREIHARKSGLVPLIALKVVE
jgi:hypothetical protein